MISGALHPTYGSSNLHFMKLIAPDVADEVPVLGPGMHPISLVHIMELEGVCDGKTQFRVEREQPETDTIHVANTMMPITSCFMS